MTPASCPFFGVPLPLISSDQFSVMLPWVPETFHVRFPVSVKSYKTSGTLVTVMHDSLKK